MIFSLLIKKINQSFHPAMETKYGKFDCYTLRVLILEKAWAKLYGNYAQIEAGLTKEALRDLTCAPAFTLFVEPRNSNYLWE